MSKICEITLSPDKSVSARSWAVFCWAFFMRRLSSSAGAKFHAELFYKKSHDFSLFPTQLTLFRPKNSIGLKNNWIYVRKCQKFAKSRCRPTFSQWNKTSGNIPLWNHLDLVPFEESPGCAPCSCPIESILVPGWFSVQSIPYSIEFSQRVHFLPL